MLVTDNSRRSSSTWMGMSAKHASLVTLTVQNSTLILILYYSRIMPLVNGQRYFSSTAVFLNEVLKLAVCASIALYEISRNVAPSTPATALFSTLTHNVFTGDSWKLAIPATLYTLQNSLQYVAISHLDAATLQVTYQFKILPIAIFSVIILRRSLSAQKWAALALLMFGVAVVQLPASPSSGLGPLRDIHSRLYLPRSIKELKRWGQVAPVGLHKRSATYEGITEDLGLDQAPKNAVLGLSAALLACTVSALGSVYFEKILKESTVHVSIWVRNVQLAVYSIFPAFFIGVIFVDGEAISKAGFFIGYNWVVWGVIASQAAGGILVALCVHYADTIAKSFATSLSILLSLFFSIMIFDFKLTKHFLIGTSITLLATWLYNTADTRGGKPPAIHLSESEKVFDKRNIAIKLPLTPLKEEAMTTSRPGSPALHHSRRGSSREYFSAKKE